MDNDIICVICKMPTYFFSLLHAGHQGFLFSPWNISSFVSHLTQGTTSRSFVFAVIFIWTDSSFLVFPLKCHSPTRPQHSSSLRQVSWILFVVVFVFTKVLWLKCQSCSPIQSCLLIWFLWISVFVNSRGSQAFLRIWWAWRGLP